MQFDPTTDCAKYNIVATLKNASLDNFQLFVKKRKFSLLLDRETRFSTAQLLSNKTILLIYLFTFLKFLRMIELFEELLRRTIFLKFCSFAHFILGIT